jgi:hypothetical protein
MVVHDDHLFICSKFCSQAFALAVKGKIIWGKWNFGEFDRNFIFHRTLCWNFYQVFKISEILFLDHLFYRESEKLPEFEKVRLNISYKFQRICKFVRDLL